MSQSILLGISGGIAAYKSVDLVRRLRALNHTVRVVMTQAAQQFITPLTLQAISGHPVHCDLLDAASEAAMDHISLARFADRVIIAPASANTIAKLAHGIADDLLTTICLATKAPIALAPAMNHVMWHHPITQSNVARLRQLDYSIWGPAEGEQACGEYGFGRMLEPEDIIQCLETNTAVTALTGKTIIITAGPTREPLDAVRFISNRSSGKMGYALAIAAQQCGANVILISGPVALPQPNHVTYIKVETAEEMQQAVLQHLPRCDVYIGAAAVADFKPVTVMPYKASKEEIPTTLELRRNPDIIETVTQSTPKPFTVGFAAQTHDVKLHALRKLKQKNMDIIIANQVGTAEGGFDSDVNSVDVYSCNEHVHFPNQPKSLLAYGLIKWIGDYYRKMTAICEV